MANWLQKIMSPGPGAQNSPNLPAKTSSPPLLAVPRPVATSDSLPPASLIYGVAASALFVVAVYFLLTGVWFTGLLVLLPATCFLGFALYFLKAR